MMLTENLTVISMVVAVVACILGIGYAALYFLDKSVDGGGV
jgi:hypothetical protein